MKKVTNNQKQKLNIKNIIKSNIKLLTGLIVGLAMTGVVYATSFASIDVAYDNTSSNLSSDNVQDAIDELKKAAENCGSGTSELQVGDYVEVVPDASTYSIPTSVTGYDSAQTITPNELTLWRIININSNGTYDAVSEYISSTNVCFKGTTGYANFVGGLQTIAAQYAKSGYTVGTRMMGYDGQTLTISNTSAFNGSSTTAPSTTSTPSPTTGTGQNYTKYSTGDLGDTLYLKDYLLVQNVYQQDNNTKNYCGIGLCAYQVGTATNTSYWIASRDYIYSGDTNFHFNGRLINLGGDLHLYVNGSIIITGSLRSYYSSGWNDYSISNALRPILTLKSGITITGGYGVKSQPYTIQ